MNNIFQFLKKKKKKLVKLERKELRNYDKYNQPIII